MEHTKGPWRVGDAGQTIFGPPRVEKSPVDGQYLAPEMIRGKANNQRAVACVNGCDAAGIVEPGALAELLYRAAEALRLDVGGATRLSDNVAVADRLRAALAAVRGM